MEGREPRDLHPAQTYEPAKRNRLIVNVPPFHAKSATLTMDYVTYRLCLDPSFRVIVISAGQSLAGDFLYGIKQRLTDPDYIDLQMAYAPDGGWQQTADSWTETRIVFGQRVRATGTKQFHEKDANVLALGMRSKVYGRRADLIIVDDGVDTNNVSEHSKQLKWLRSMVESRLEAGGKLLVVGTRVASIDLYSELRNPENYGNGVVPWTYFASPAILEEARDPRDHVTLWPYAQVPWVHADDAEMDECMCGQRSCSEGFDMPGVGHVYARWDGIHLERGPRDGNSATDWALIYQQKSVAENATFPEYKISKATNTQRLPGPLKVDQFGHPLGGMHGKYIIAGLDPSIKGFAGIVIGAVDRDTQRRYILDCRNWKAPTATELKEYMKQKTLELGIHEWVVEKTGLLQFFTQDESLRLWFASHGVKFTEHNTGANKWHEGFGVSSMAALLGEYDKPEDNPLGDWRQITPPLIEFPRVISDSMKALIHQLITWTPELDPNKVPCDMVMALWFFHVGAMRHLGVGQSGKPLSLTRGNKFTSPRSRVQRGTVRISDYRA